MSSPTTPIRTVNGLLHAKRGNNGRLHWTDTFTYLYLALGILLMFGPVIWLALSSFKTSSALLEFPPTFLPLGQVEVQVEGYSKNSEQSLGGRRTSQTDNATLCEGQSEATACESLVTSTMIL